MGGQAVTVVSHAGSASPCDPAPPSLPDCHPVARLTRRRGRKGGHQVGLTPETAACAALEQSRVTEAPQQPSGRWPTTRQRGRCRRPRSRAAIMQSPPVDRCPELPPHALVTAAATTPLLRRPDHERVLAAAAPTLDVIREHVGPSPTAHLRVRAVCNDARVGLEPAAIAPRRRQNQHRARMLRMTRSRRV